MDQTRDTAKLKRMLEGPDYCLQLFMAVVLGQPESGPRWRRIRSARIQRLAHWPRPSSSENRRRSLRRRPPRP